MHFVREPKLRLTCLGQQTAHAFASQCFTASEPLDLPENNGKFFFFLNVCLKQNN